LHNIFDWHVALGAQINDYTTPIREAGVSCHSMQ